MVFKPVFAVAGALLLTAGIYFGANTVPPAPKAQGGMQQSAQMPKAPAFNVDSFENQAKSGLSQHALGELLAVDKQMPQVNDSQAMAPLFGKYAKIWQEHRNIPLAAWYYSLEAKLENSEKKLTFAAQLFLGLAQNEHDQVLQYWEASNAGKGFERVLAINPNADSAKLGLAEVYFGTGEAMKGVALLKELTTKDPEHLAANLLLGRQGLVSGQYDKAKVRFETVLKKDPKNLEAMLGLAEALKSTGEKEKAIAVLQECKSLIKDPAFAKDIDEYIKTFK